MPSVATTMYLSLGIKRLERGVDHPIQYRAEVKERVELYIYTPSVPAWYVGLYLQQSGLSWGGACSFLGSKTAWA